MTNNRGGIFDVFVIFGSVRYMYAGKLVPNLPLVLVDEWETSAVRNVTTCGWLEYCESFQVRVRGCERII